MTVDEISVLANCMVSLNQRDSAGRQRFIGALAVYSGLAQWSWQPGSDAAQEVAHLKADLAAAEGHIAALQNEMERLERAAVVRPTTVASNGDDPKREPDILATRPDNPRRVDWAQRALTYLREHGQQYPESLASGIGCSWPTARKYARALVKQNLVIEDEDGNFTALDEDEAAKREDDAALPNFGTLDGIKE